MIPYCEKQKDILGTTSKNVSDPFCLGVIINTMAILILRKLPVEVFKMKRNECLSTLMHMYVYMMGEGMHR